MSNSDHEEWQENARRQLQEAFERRVFFHVSFMGESANAFFFTTNLGFSFIVRGLWVGALSSCCGKRFMLTTVSGREHVYRVSCTSCQASGTTDFLHSPSEELQAFLTIGVTHDEVKMMLDEFLLLERNVLEVATVRSTLDDDFALLKKLLLQ